MQGDAVEEPDGILQPIVNELRRNAGIAGRLLRLDVIVLVSCAALFFMCDRIFIDAVSVAYPDSTVSYLLRCHAIDTIGGYAFMAYTNLLLDLIKPDMRFKRAFPSLVFMTLCGVFWEGMAPLFVPDSTGDVLDIIAYLLGACCYLLIVRAFSRRNS